MAAFARESIIAYLGVLDSHLVVSGHSTPLYLSALAKALLADIAHEERELLIPEVIRDDHVVLDQSDG